MCQVQGLGENYDNLIIKTQINGQTVNLSEDAGLF